jgi:hypothetical protein
VQLAQLLLGGVGGNIGSGVGANEIVVTRVAGTGVGGNVGGGVGGSGVGNGVGCGVGGEGVHAGQSDVPDAQILAWQHAFVPTSQNPSFERGDLRIQSFRCRISTTRTHHLSAERLEPKRIRFINWLVRRRSSFATDRVVIKQPAQRHVTIGQQRLSCSVSRNASSRSIRQHTKAAASKRAGSERALHGFRIRNETQC